MKPATYIFAPIFSLLFIHLILISFYGVPANDVWYHTKTGEIILRNLSVPDHDIFSFTAPNLEWINHQWLSQVLLAVGHHFLGDSGFDIFMFVFILSPLLMLYILLEKNNVSLPVRVFTLCFALSLLSQRAEPRPFLITDFFMTLTVLIGSNYPKFLFLFPFFTMIGANAHGGYIIVLFVSEFFLAMNLLKSISEKNDRDARRSILILVLNLCAPLVNPNGFKILRLPFQFLSKDVFKVALREWRPFEYDYTRLQDNMLVLYGFLSLASLFFILNQFSRSQTPSERIRHFQSLLPLITGLGLMALAVRNIDLFAILTALAVSKTLDAWMESFESKKIPQSAMAASTVVFSLLLVASQINEVHSRARGWLQKIYPFGACEFIKNNHIKGNIYNPCGWGSFIIYANYPDIKVSLDGRAEVYGEISFILNEFMANNPTPQLDVFDKMNVDLVLLDYTIKSNIYQYLFNNQSKWALVYWDDAGLLYLRRTEKHRPIIEAHEYKYAVPIEEITSDLLQKGYKTNILDEAARKSLEDPDCYKAISILAGIHMVDGNLDEVKRLSEKILEITRHHDGAYYNLAYYYFKQGRIDTSMDCLHKAINLSPENPLFYMQMGNGYMSRNDFSNAEKYFLKAMRLEYESPDPYVGLGRLYYKTGDLKKAEQAMNIASLLSRQ